jgi:hypothetical protein
MRYVRVQCVRKRSPSGMSDLSDATHLLSPERCSRGDVERANSNKQPIQHYRHASGVSLDSRDHYGCKSGQCHVVVSFQSFQRDGKRFDLVVTHSSSVTGNMWW